jgi:chromosomal replication initiator protein
MRSIWENVKREIEPTIPKKSFQLWINPVTFLEKKDDTIVLGCPNKFSRDWIRDNYLGLIEQRLDSIGEAFTKKA